MTTTRWAAWTSEHATCLCDGATKEDGQEGREAGWAWGSTADELGNRTDRRQARMGDREAGWALDSTVATTHAGWAVVQPHRGLDAAKLSTQSREALLFTKIHAVLDTHDIDLS